LGKSWNEREGDHPRIKERTKESQSERERGEKGKKRERKRERERERDSELYYRRSLNPPLWLEHNANVLSFSRFP